MYKQELDTPCIVVDLDKLKANIDRVQRLADEAGIALRPHVKTHKTPQIAKMQLNAGAIGIAVAKLGEAEVIAEAGVGSILIAYPIVGKTKLERLMRLASRAEVTVAVDSLEAAAGISDTALAAGIVVPVWIEVDPGYGRVGVQPGPMLVHLAQQLLPLKGIAVTGVLAFAGQSYDEDSDEGRSRVARHEAALASEAAQALRELGFPIESVSVGSTPVSRFASNMKGATEMRTGTYVFGDLTQVKAGAMSLEQCALTVLVTVVSRPASDRAVVDAGTKVFTSDGEDSPIGTGRGYVVGHPAIEVAWFNEEHGVLHLPPEERGLKVGDRLEIVPVHCCAVVNMLDVIHQTDGDTVTEVLTIEGRGRVR
ncbi:alanine racemase [Paenibacillus ginsengarvi]|uniref:Alanine racemase n=1 Tax=Paenibacillus ginsengarvi TaxID=400777 RepID=A0A3B0C815_9BACL|nr:alanine racemase [Paenibacillus ginsengarvi]RKN80499.1 alanine racemase [Paenibacillus ginsengarvi]